MEFIIGIIIVIVVLYFISMMQHKEYIEKCRSRLKNNWGKVSDQEYSAEKFLDLRTYFDENKQGGITIDDITWNDLDLDEIYKIINHTESSIGEEYLYALLRKPQLEKEVLEERNRLIDYFTSNEKERMELQTIFAIIGKLRGMSVYEYINRVDDLEPKSNAGHYAFGAGLLSSIIFMPFIPAVGVTLLVIMVINNVYRYYKRKGEIDKYIWLFRYILGILHHNEKLTRCNRPEIQRYIDELKDIQKELRHFKRGAFILVSGKGMGGSLFDSIMDYERMLFHSDLIKFNHMLKEIREKKDRILRIFELIGLLDSMISIASYRALMQTYTVPELVPYRPENKQHIMEFENLYHPLVEEPVPNSIYARRGVLLTGSNASGKSTFIKTVAVNAILAQTIYTVLAKTYRANYFKIYSSMALRDNIMSRESYYIVEIKSLKRIIDHIHSEIPVLCFVDEVLRGTNTLERIASSSMILSKIAEGNALCFAATHDIELTHILEEQYDNYHFTETIEEDDILFDYVLYKGRAVSRNAIKLLSLIGYDNDIVEKAKKMADDFLEQGIWKR